MRVAGVSGSFWPSEQQTLLLRTALSPPAESVAAWDHLRPKLDLDDLEPGSYPLLPLVYRHLTRLGSDDAYLPRLAGIYRRTWYLNHIRLPEVEPAVRALDRAGCGPLVLGGWGMLTWYGGDLGLRGVEEFSVLVRPRTDTAGARALAKLGYNAPGARSSTAPLARSDGRACVLHERFSREFSVPETRVEVEDVRARAERAQIGAFVVPTLCAADALVHVCLAGARATAVPNPVWLADAMTILAAGSAIDWDRLVRQAELLRAPLRLHDALLYLRRYLGGEVPEGVVQLLRAVATKPRERLAHRASGWSVRSGRPVPRSAIRLLHVTADRRLLSVVATAPSFLRDEIRLEYAKSLSEVAQRVLGRRRTAATPVPRSDG